MFFKVKNSKLINIILIFFSSLLPILAADFILKNLRLPKDSSRIMLLAGSSLYSSKNGYRRYEANKNIEQIAIYHDQIAYRYFYNSNNLGLVSYPDLKNNIELDLTINGDSFAEGQGGYPWIIEWQKNELKKLDILSLNYAIAGNGFGDFLKASSNARKNYNAKKNIIFFIEHDAYRPYQEISKNKKCSFYSNGLLDNILGNLTCKTYGIVWHHINSNKTNTQILNDSKYLQQYGVFPTFYSFFKTLRNFSFKKEIKKSNDQINIPHTNNNLRFGPIPTETKIAIKEINKLFGKENVLYVKLPDSKGESNIKSKIFIKLISEVDNNKVLDLGEICILTKTDFHHLDNHPNIKGYKKIKKCIVENKVINNFIKN